MSMGSGGTPCTRRYSKDKVLAGKYERPGVESSYGSTDYVYMILHRLFAYRDTNPRRCGLSLPHNVVAYPPKL